MAGIVSNQNNGIYKFQDVPDGGSSIPWSLGSFGKRGMYDRSAWERPWGELVGQANNDAKMAQFFGNRDNPAYAPYYDNNYNLHALVDTYSANPQQPTDPQQPTGIESPDGGSEEEDDPLKKDKDEAAKRYAQLWDALQMDKQKALQNLRYAPILGSLYEMNNSGNLVDPDPYEQLYWNTLSRARVSADGPVAPVRYDRYDPNAQMARLASSQAQAARGTQQMYGSRPGLAAGALANLFMRGNEQMGQAALQGQMYNNQVAMQEDQANYQRQADWLNRRAAAMQHNSQLETMFGNSVNELWQNADMANRATKFGNRQQFYKNLGLLGQDAGNQYRAGMSTIMGFESGGATNAWNDPQEKDKNSTN